MALLECVKSKPLLLHQIQLDALAGPALRAGQRAGARCSIDISAVNRQEGTARSEEPRRAQAAAEAAEAGALKPPAGQAAWQRQAEVGLRTPISSYAHDHISLHGQQQRTHGIFSSGARALPFASGGRCMCCQAAGKQTAAYQRAADNRAAEANRGRSSGGSGAKEAPAGGHARLGRASSQGITHSLPITHFVSPSDSTAAFRSNVVRK